MFFKHFATAYFTLLYLKFKFKLIQLYSETKLINTNYKNTSTDGPHAMSLSQDNLKTNLNL